MSSTLASKKILMLTFFMSAITQAGLVLYTPAFLKISQDLHISSSLVKITLTGYLLGFGVSQLFYGPLSDRFGRKKPLLLGLFIFSVGCLLSIVSLSYSSLLLSRIIQGCGLGSCMTLSRAILRDSFAGDEYIKMATYLSSGFAVGLGVTPVIGAYLVEMFPWRADFVFLLLCGIGLFIAFWLLLPETRHQPPTSSPFKYFITTTIANFYLSLINRAFISNLVAGVLAYGVVITYNTMAPFLFQKVIGYSSTMYGWLTLVIALSYYFSTSINRILLRSMESETIIKSGLALILLSGVAIIIGKFFNYINLYFIFLPLMIATFGQALIWSTSIANALKDLPQIAGTAAAFFSCMQMLLSGVISAIIALFPEYNQLPIGMVIIILAVTSWTVFYFFIFNDTYKTSVQSFS